MERRQSNKSSHSTLADLPSEKKDPLMEHLKNVDALNGAVFPGSSNNDPNLYRNGENTDLESQEPVSRALTRADTAAYVTKHPSRIPDAGMSQLIEFRQQ
jgi:hypothetical protein